MSQWPEHLLLAELLGKHIQKSPLRQQRSGLLVNVQRLANSTLRRQFSQVSNSDIRGSDTLETGSGGSLLNSRAGSAAEIILEQEPLAKARAEWVENQLDCARGTKLPCRQLLKRLHEGSDVITGRPCRCAAATRQLAP